MSGHMAGRERPLGQTSGSPQRAGQPHGGPALTFDLPAELDRLRREESWQRGDRNARTLVKEPDFRIVLTVLKDGAQLRQHSAAGPTSVQTIAGHLRLLVADQTVDLPAGHVLVMDANVAHDVVAVGESAFLLTVGWHEAGADAG